MRPFLTLGLALALPALSGPAHAEGARLHVACSVSTTCSPTGACRPGFGEANFVLSPVSTEAGGAGTYSVEATGADAPVEATALSLTGPYLWMSGEYRRETLTLTGEKSALWMRQRLPTDDRSGDAELHLLSCKITG